MRSIATPQVLIDESFTTRRAALESLQFDGLAARLTDSNLVTDVTKLDGEFNAARARGNEGLMIKDPRSKYKPGRRGREWLKLKRALATLDVVVTAVEVGNGRRSRFLSDYTFAVRASESDPDSLKRRQSLFGTDRRGNRRAVGMVSRAHVAGVCSWEGPRRRAEDSDRGHF